MKRFVYFVFGCLLICCCNSRKVGKYVYRDKERVIHIDRGCTEIKNPIAFVDTSNLLDWQVRRVCHKCVNADAFEELKAIMERLPQNSDSINAVMVVVEEDENNEDVKWLYGKLKAKGYNIGSEADFTSSLANGEDRKWYYNKAKGMGLNVGSEADFDSVYAPKQAAKPAKKEKNEQVQQPSQTTSFDEEEDEEEDEDDEEW